MTYHLSDHFLTFYYGKEKFTHFKHFYQSTTLHTLFLPTEKKKKTPQKLTFVKQIALYNLFLSQLDSATVILLKTAFLKDYNKLSPHLSIMSYENC